MSGNLRLSRNETVRLAALHRYDVLDTPHERSFDTIAELIRRTLDVPIASVTLMAEDRLCFKSIRGNKMVSMPRDQSFCSYVVANMNPVIINDTHDDPRTATHPMVVGDPNLGSYVGVPLMTQDGHCIGTVCALDTKPRAFGTAQISILEGFAEVVMNQIDLRHHAERDELTAALSRRAFLNEMQREIVRFVRYHRPSALILIDVDQFKAVNDTMGHAAGDDVLREIGIRCEHIKRLGDAFGRLGGDEFAFLLPETEEADALMVAERLREALAMGMSDAVGQPISASFGVAILCDETAAIESWLKVADQGLYAAKKAGRNRCCVGRPDGKTPPN